MEIAFKQFANTLSTRSLGSEIRTQISQSIRKGDFVTLNFDGISTVSNSFADECFGKLLLEFDFSFIKSHTTFKHINKFSSKTIFFSIKSRLEEAELSEI